MHLSESARQAIRDIPRTVHIANGKGSAHRGRGSIAGDADHLTPDQLEVGEGIEFYKRSHRRPYPTWSEVHAIFLALGYRKAGAAP